MKTLYIEPMIGCSGDMLLGALASCGADMARLETELQKMTGDVLTLKTESAVSCGIAGTRMEVHAHDHPADHDVHGHHHEHPVRHLNEVQALISAAGYSRYVQEQAFRVFECLAEAEATVHGTTPEKIHFHEVGALDSIADIVGFCLGLELLGIEQLAFSVLPIGHGTIECAHGTYPNPPPAAQLICRGLQLQSMDEPYELVTPTAAALLKTLGTQQPVAAGELQDCGYGIGHRTLKRHPNVVRASVYQTIEATGSTPSTCVLLESNIDDATPEVLAHVFDKLLAEGALDVFTTAVGMKKQRAGTMLSVLTASDRKEAMLDLIFRETTTFGVREQLIHRSVLKREQVSVETVYGTIRIKQGYWKGDCVTRAPEIEDCRRAAQEHDVPLKEVVQAAMRKAGADV